MLKGSALSAIARIPFTSENYSLVVKLLQERLGRKCLQERFGRKEAIVQSYFKLQDLPKTGNKFADIQWVSEIIEKAIRQLEAQGESIDEQRVLIQQIISKYPPEVITKLEEAKEPLRPWSIKSLRKAAICDYVIVQENVQCYVSSVNTNVKGQHFVPRQLTSDSHRSSAEVLTANSQRGSQQEGQIKALPCIFCEGNHFNVMCDQFTTLTERKQILSQQRRCFICLKVGHVLKDYTSPQKKVCCHCGRIGNHNRCLCPQKFPRQETDALLVTEPSQSSSENNANPTIVLLMRVWVYMTTANSNATPMLLASGERVTMD